MQTLFLWVRNENSKTWFVNPIFVTIQLASFFSKEGILIPRQVCDTKQWYNQQLYTLCMKSEELNKL